jgi:ATP/maltotriose-dependent transcriptional regulator MalT
LSPPAAPAIEMSETRGARCHRLLAAIGFGRLEVARLIVDRKTNHEIAQELFVSLKTVETHVRNMLFKLEVTSRVELARAVERAARDTPEA